MLIWYDICIPTYLPGTNNCVLIANQQPDLPVWSPRQSQPCVRSNRTRPRRPRRRPPNAFMGTEGSGPSGLAEPWHDTARDDPRILYMSVPLAHIARTSSWCTGTLWFMNWMGWNVLPGDSKRLEVNWSGEYWETGPVRLLFTLARLVIWLWTRRGLSLPAVCLLPTTSILGT